MKESIFLLNNVFVQPVLTYASPGWFPFLCNAQPITWKSYTELHAGLLLGASLPPLLPTPFEAQLPHLKPSLKHQALSSFERALRLPPDFSGLYALATKNVPCRLKKKPSWRSFCSSATQPLPSLREILIMCLPFPIWTVTHFIVSPFIADCAGNSTARLQSASSRLSSLPLLISKYGLTDPSPPFLVPVVLECMSHAPNAIYPIPCPFPLVQLPPASQMKPLPSSKVSIGVLAI